MLWRVIAAGDRRAGGEAGGELRNLGAGPASHPTSAPGANAASAPCPAEGTGNTEGMSTQDYKQRGGWLPEQDDLESWLKRLEKTERESHEPLHPAVERLRELVESDPTLRMYAIRMIEQVPTTKPYGRRPLHSLEQLLG